MTSVLVVSDVVLYRLGIAHFLERDGRVTVTGSAGDGDSAVHAAGAAAPDVVLLDTTMPGYEAIAAALSGEVPGVRVLALTVAETEQAVVACAAAGAVGYVTRESSLDALVAAIDGAMRGEAILSPLMAGVLLRRAGGTAAADSREPPLTRRQREIGVLLGEGLSNKEIAARLCIEVTTVKNHVHQILEKLQVERRSDVAAALARGGGRPGI
ncbi:MAG TPA: response regulator transcription factor [Gaiellaceae bacterium]|nr:response regulator transcription factor [Gaiellaceae bacterium]